MYALFHMLDCREHKSLVYSFTQYLVLALFTEEAYLTQMFIYY